MVSRGPGTRVYCLYKITEVCDYGMDEVEAYLLVVAGSPPDRRGRRGAPWCPGVRGQGSRHSLSSHAHRRRHSPHCLATHFSQITVLKPVVRRTIPTVTSERDISLSVP